MGLAEVVPGVSGGTIALLTGIYPALIDALSRFGPKSLTQLRSPQVFIAHHRLGLLIPLGLGMALGVLVFARVMEYLLSAYPPAVWAFFCGVILMSVLHVGRLADMVQPLRLMIFVVGIAAGLALLWLPEVDQPGDIWVLLAGAIAICAWILPAVSGSFVMLALGFYETILGAIVDFDLRFLVIFGTGCGLGLFAFVRLLRWLLTAHYHGMMALLSGLMLGSLANLWPWRSRSLELADQFLSPAAYAAQTAQPGLVALSLVTFLLGIGLTFWMVRYQD